MFATGGAESLLIEFLKIKSKKNTVRNTTAIRTALTFVRLDNIFNCIFVPKNS